MIARHRGLVGAMADLRNTVFRVGLETLYFSGAHHAFRPFYGGVGAILTLHHVRPARAGLSSPTGSWKWNRGFSSG